MFAQIFIGLTMVAVGFLMLQFHEQVYSFTGAISWVERHVRAGTRSFIKLAGVVLILLGIGTAIGMWDWILAPVGESIRSMFQIKR